MSDKTLEQIVDEAIYTAMLDERPTLVDAIAAMITVGQTPAQIEYKMAQRFGSIQMVRNVRHIAEHLTRQR